MEDKKIGRLEVAVEEITREAVNCSVKKNKLIVIVGGSDEEKRNLTKFLNELNSNVKIDYQDIRSDFLSGLKYVGGSYFIEFKKISIIYPKD